MKVAKYDKQAMEHTNDGTHPFKYGTLNSARVACGTFIYITIGLLDTQ